MSWRWRQRFVLEAGFRMDGQDAKLKNHLCNRKLQRLSDAGKALREKCFTAGIGLIGKLFQPGFRRFKQVLGMAGGQAG